MIFGSDLGSGLGAEMQAYLDKTLLTNISEMTVYDKYATMNKGLPLKQSKELRFDKWIRMIDTYNAGNNINSTFTGNDYTVGEESLQNIKAGEYNNFVLEEGSSGASKAKMKLIKSSATVFPIGDWMPYTEEMEMFHNRWSVAETAKQMGEMAGLVIDGFYRDLYNAGAGHTTTIAPGTDIATATFASEVRKTVVALRLSGAKYINAIMSSSPNYGTVPVRSRYVMMVHTIAAEALRNNSAFVPVEKYRDRGGLLENEEGTIGECIVVSNPEASLVYVSSGKYTAICTIFGKDHTAHIPIRGKNSTNFVYQPIGSAGTGDALKRVGTTGWKSWLGAKVLYPERLGTITVEVNF